MIGGNTRVVSESRMYVAICISTNFDRYYFRIFRLPSKDGQGIAYDNNAERASWYFLNVIDFVACLGACVPLENFSDVCIVDERGNRIRSSFNQGN